MKDPVVIESYNPEWKIEFDQIASNIRAVLKERASRIDHIGSTSIEGLDAKPIIDIQISVNSFEPFDELKEALESIGYRYKPDNTELTKRYFREKEYQKRTHIHVRLDGHWSQQYPLLFRDYVRTHPEEKQAYETLKHELANTYKDQRSKYVSGKETLIWEIMRRADRWAQETGWICGASDY